MIGFGLAAEKRALPLLRRNAEQRVFADDHESCGIVSELQVNEALAGAIGSVVQCLAGVVKHIGDQGTEGGVGNVHPSRIVQVHSTEFDVALLDL